MPRRNLKNQQEYTLERHRRKGGIRARFTHVNGNILMATPQSYDNDGDLDEMLNRLIRAIQAGKFDYWDKEHGRTTTKIPDDSEDDPDDADGFPGTSE